MIKQGQKFIFKLRLNETYKNTDKQIFKKLKYKYNR